MYNKENAFIWAMVVIMLVLLGVAIYGYSTGRWEPPQEQQQK